MTAPERIIVGISGASGAAIGVRIVELLAQTQSCEIHVVVSPAGERTLPKKPALRHWRSSDSSPVAMPAAISAPASPAARSGHLA